MVVEWKPLMVRVWMTVVSCLLRDKQSEGIPKAVRLS